MYSHAPLTEWPCKIHWSGLTKEQKKGQAQALGVVLVALTKEELGDDEFDECLRKSIKEDRKTGQRESLSLRSEQPHGGPPKALLDQAPLGGSVKCVVGLKRKREQRQRRVYKRGGMEWPTANSHCLI
jgi:hypothetical protein